GYGQPGYAPPGYAPPPLAGGPPPGYAAPQQWPAQQPYQQAPAGYYPVWNSQGQQVLVPLASPGKRFGAYLLDLLLIIVTLVIGWLVWLFIDWGKGQTPGKQLLN